MTAASDGETFVTRGPGGDSVTGPPAAVPALAAALDGAPSEPHAVSGLTALEEAEVEERLRELGYL